MKKSSRKDDLSEDRRKRRVKLAIIVPIIVLGIISALIFAGSRDPSQGDISVEFTTQVLGNSSMKEKQLVAGKEALLTFMVKDAGTGKPISGLEPDISFYSAGTGESQTEHKHFFGSYFSQGEINLAKIQVFVLNSQRGTIEVLDTFGSYDPRTSAIKGMGTMSSKVIRLKNVSGKKAADMVANRYGSYVYVTIPGDNQVAVVNVISREVVKYIDTGAMPGRMFLQPGSGNLWVSNDDGGSVTIIDTDSNVLASTIETGRGYHQVAFSPQDAFVTNSENDTVKVIELDDLKKRGDIAVQVGTYGIDYSKVSNEVYVANILSGTVSVIDAGSLRVKRHIPLSKGVEMVKFSPDGKRGIVLNQHANTAYIFDAQSGDLLNAVATGEAPGAIAFMEEYALIRNTYSPDVTYISMNDPGLSNVAVLGMEPTMTWMPHSLAATSYGDEVVVTSPREGKVYFMHKMQGQPMAMSSTRVEFGSDAVAVVHNRLHETGAGIYQQYIILTREGSYDLEFRTPGMNSTFKIEVLPDTERGFDTMLLNKSVTTGSPSVLRYSIIYRKTGEPEVNLTDLVFTVIRPAITGVTTKRVPARHAGNGIYEANIIFSEEGEYMVTLSSNNLSAKGYEPDYDYVTAGKTSPN